VSSLVQLLALVLALCALYVGFLFVFSALGLGATSALLFPVAVSFAVGGP
jgi:hypothetical protein